MRFHPVVLLPPDAVVLDLTGPPPWPTARWSIGRYGERRGIYTQPLFAGGRCVHLGVDLGGPEGVAVHAFDDGVVLHVGENAAPGDYGPTIVAEHRLDGASIWALHGHLSRASLRWRPGDAFARGDVLGWLGGPHENGGWPPHLHFQLSRRRPEAADLPGAVTVEDFAAASVVYPDPRCVLGDLAPAADPARPDP